jgi:putative tricarboxylic transport membrane protein
MRPGADMFTIHVEITYTFILSLILANILILPMGIYSGKYISRLITNIPVAFLAPFIVFLSIIGSFAIHNNMFDVYVMLCFGFIGYIGRRVGFGPGPIVLGLILGSICEQGLVQAMLMGRAAGSVMAVFFGRPISLILIFLTVVSAVWPVIRRRLWKTGQRTQVRTRRVSPPRDANQLEER